MTDNTVWEFDFDGWTVGEDALYMDALARAQQSGNFRLLYPHWARMIRRWPIACNPRDLKSYAKLDDSICREIIEQINRGIHYPKREDGRMGGGET